MIVAVRAREHGKDALQELALLGVVAQTAVGDAKIEQRATLPRGRGRAPAP